MTSERMTTHDEIDESVSLTYRNWRGDVSERTITPIRLWFGSTKWHPEPQWLLTAYDHGKEAERDFALKDFGSALTGASAVGEAAPFEQSGLYGEYTPVTIGPSPATHAESLLAEAVGMLERVPGALNGMFSAGMEEREGGSARRQERYAKAGDALKAEIPAFLAKIKEKQDADA